MAREVNPPTVRRLGEQVSYKSLISAHVIVNPAAGRGAGERALDLVARAFRQQGWAVEVTRTGGPGEGAALATAAVHSGAQRVVAVGGAGGPSCRPSGGSLGPRVGPARRSSRSARPSSGSGGM